MNNRRIALWTALSLSLSLAARAALDLRPRAGFAPAIQKKSAPAPVTTLLVLPDGGFYAAGNFTSADGGARVNLVRFRGDGTIDAAFHSPITDKLIRALARQSDGKVLIGGDFNLVDGVPRSLVARLNADGSLDPTFDPGATRDEGVWSLAVQADGKVLVGGGFTLFNGTARARIARLNSNGSLDLTFNAAFNNIVRQVTVQPDGKIIAAGAFTVYNNTSRGHIARLENNGALDSAFAVGSGCNGDVNAAVLLPDGRLLLGGAFTSFDGAATPRIARLSAAGALDASFNPGSGFSNPVWTIARQPSDGKLVIGGDFTNFNAVASARIIQLESNGALDPTFAPGTGCNHTVRTLASLGNGSVIAGGDFTLCNGSPRARLAQLDSAGALAPVPAPSIRAAGTVLAAEALSDGRWVIGGDFTHVNGVARKNVAVTLADGSLDQSFDPGSGFNDVVFGLAVQSDNRFVAVGPFTSFNGVNAARIARLNPNGSLEPPVGAGFNNQAYAVAAQSDDKLLVDGAFSAYAGAAVPRLVRLHPNLSVDSTFSANPGPQPLTVGPSALAIQPDGKVVMVGNILALNGMAQGIARFNSNGSYDTNFHAGAGFDVRFGMARALAIQPDGKILVGGTFNVFSDLPRRGLLQLHSDGTLDALFDAGTGFSVNIGTHDIRAISLDEQGRVLAAGAFTTYNDAPVRHLARLDPNGLLDTAVVGASTTDAAGGFSVLKAIGDGKVLVAGSWVPFQDRLTGGLAVLEPRPKAFANPESFELGWNGWTADNSLWQTGWLAGGPPATSGFRAHSGQRAATTQSVIGGPFPGNNYARSSVGRLISAPFVVPGAGAGSLTALRFWQWFSYGTGDQGELQISTERDAGWSEWTTLGTPATNGTSRAWSEAIVDLTSFQGQTARLAFRHSANNDASIGAGWFIDDVEISGLVPSPLELGTIVSGNLTLQGTRAYFAVDVPPGANLRLHLDGGGGSVSPELYVRRGALPTAGAYDGHSVGRDASGQEVLVSKAAAGRWYVLVDGTSLSAPGAYTLKVESIPGLLVTGVSPTTVGNSTPATVVVSGAGFDDVQAALVSGPTTVAVGTVKMPASDRLLINVNVTGLAPGDYELRLNQETNAYSAPFKITSGGQSHFEARLISPSMVGRHAPATLLVEYANTGTVAMDAPLLLVHGSDRALLTLKPELGVVGLWTTAVPRGFGDTVQFLASGQSAGLLQPGEHGRVSVLFVGLQQPWDFADASVRFDLSIFNPTNQEPANWSARQADLKPAAVPDDAWASVFANFVDGMGTTWGDYVTRLAATARSMADYGVTVTDVRDLSAFLYTHADGLGPVSVLTSVTDAALAAPGIDLVFRRIFYSSVSQRYRPGVLGRGWTHNYDFHAEKEADGTVVIRTPDGSRRTFQPDSRKSSFFNDRADFGRLTSLGGGRLQLTESDGLKRVFGSEGALDYVEDLKGNRVTATYSSGRLTRLVHSSGPALVLAYAQELLASVIDPAGRAVAYTYDAAGHLAAATALEGTTLHYAYNTDARSRAQHALTSITRPDGRQTFFTYDESGRLTRLAQDDGAEAVSLSYPAPGTVLVTDAEGRAWTFNYGPNGTLLALKDPLGHTRLLRYDARAQLTSFVGPDAGLSEFAHDELGHAVRSIDPLGQTVARAYTGNAQLSRVVNPLGQSTRLSYDAEGNLTEVIAPDDTRVTLTADSQGEVATRKNRRGLAISFIRDSTGRITRKLLPDGQNIDYAYDDRGRLTSVRDSDGGLTRLEYDSRDLLTAVTYPNGAGFAYVYDAAGRRTRRTSHDGYIVQYTFDSAGRLQELTDGQGRRVAAYRYNGNGRLAREDKGNGDWTTYEYDPAGHLAHLINGAPGGEIRSRFDYTYDAAHRPTSVRALNGVTRYDYDAAGQLTRAALPDGQQLSYNYDAAGNRLRTAAGAIATAYSVNALNQYTRVGEEALTYDADGNLTARRNALGATTYEYDVENRLVRVVTPKDGVWNYTYDIFGNCASVEHDGQLTRRVFDPFGLGDLVAEYNAASGLIARYDYGVGLVSRVSSSNDRAFYAFDGLGSVHHLTDSTGTILNHYEYDPFGVVSALEEAVPNSFRFIGKYGVVDSAGGSYWMKRRQYDARLGRFLSEDPLLPSADESNSYRYAGNAPTLFIDPEGTELLWLWNGIRHEASPPSDPRDMGGYNRARHEIVIYDNNSDVTTLPHEMTHWLLDLFTGGRATHRLSEAAAYGVGGIAGYIGFDFDAGNEQVGQLIRVFQGSDPTLYANDPTWFSKRPVLPEPPSEFADRGQSDTRTANDPNELIGPAGYGPSHFIPEDAVLPYRINFENLKTATAPAQVVVVRNPIPADLDLDSFQLTSFGFGDVLTVVPPATRHFERTEHVRFNETSFDVNISLALDEVARELQVRFDSVVPNSGLPPAVDVGFLPPEDGSFRGKGHVAYTIKPKPGLPTETQIRNIGFVTFDPRAGGATYRTDLSVLTDPNSPPDLNRQALVTIDATGPASAIGALSDEASGRQIEVRWAGTDTGAGIDGYDVYVQTDHGPWAVWLNGTTNASAIWSGDAGRTYGFYSTARDGAGHREPSPTAGTAAQAETHIPADLGEITGIAVASVGTDQSITLIFTGGNPGEIWHIEGASRIAGPWNRVGAMQVQPDMTARFSTTNSARTETTFYRAVTP